MTFADQQDLLLDDKYDVMGRLGCVKSPSLLVLQDNLLEYLPTRVVRHQQAPEAVHDAALKQPPTAGRPYHLIRRLCQRRPACIDVEAAARKYEPRPSWTFAVGCSPALRCRGLPLPSCCLAQRRARSRSVTDAILGWLVHSAQKIEMKGESLRKVLANGRQTIREGGA